MRYVFWLSLAVLIYTYAGYPALTVVLGRLMRRRVATGGGEPGITLVIAAYNEAAVIGPTIENKLALDYPRSKLQIIVVSDSSVDDTDRIAQRYADQGVLLLRQTPRRGKTAALNLAAQRATGDVIVFADANSMYAPDTLRMLARNFSDPTVGYVTGRLVYGGGESAVGVGCRAYMAYEDLLRRSETSLGSIIGVNGGVDAIRRDLYVDVPRNLITDFVLPLSVIAAGRRVVFEPRARSQEVPNSELGSEFRMRVRVALRALQGLAYMRRLFNPLRYPLTAFCLASHKVLRYAGFIFLAVALAANALLAAHSAFYAILLGLQLVAYALGFLGLWQRPQLLRRLTVLPAYVCMTYAAFAVASVKFARGESMATWRPRAG